ncbi:MAG: tRNA dihydrouridine(20/20a) synthase DusA [Myxococcales bacterium]|nr:tRNA dihydrouridine(20/20a) synthase DusA [Myxococcales bacterium]MCB9542957.1 tRNA dihydrouridine(20/20a) synthase DusA [Myxococcales bacterium]MCB9551546.1 tRNA dihydrouridine(20/20a) synthase DusA [Myxococcales bacterium]
MTDRRGTLRPLSVAPMMQRTDRHDRYFMRQLSRRTLLYTEMVTTGAILHGDAHRHLAFHPAERPLALQLGGDDPRALVAAARIALDYGYDEINLNIGCPSDRVQKGRFGACLMAHPEVVADGVAALRAAIPLPVTVKHRIGIDDRDAYEDMLAFVDPVAAAGADRFTVHARKAWLSGLSPKENREIPPLRYPDVHRLKRERPHLAIEINGGVTTLAAALDQLAHVDAVMIGRAAYDTPAIFAEADALIFGEPDPPPDLLDVAEAMVPYAAAHLEAGGRLHHVTRHLLTLFNGLPGAKAWRRRLNAAATDAHAGLDVLTGAIAARRAAAFDPAPEPTSPELHP